MKALVTGGAGFIGSHGAEALLEDGAEVLIIDNLSTGKKANLPQKAAFLELDICSEELKKVILEFKPEIIFQLAAQIDVQKSIFDPAFDAYVNIVGAIKLLEAAREAKVKKIVYSSSAAVYGEPCFLPVTEEHQILPLSAYGISKHTVEHYLTAYKKLYNINYSILRYGNVFGPRQDPLGEAGVVAIFTSKVLKGEPCSIFGDGKQTRDFVYVKDIAAANLLAAKAPGSQIVNIATGVETSINEVFALLRDLSGQNQSQVIRKEARQGEIRRMVMSTEKAKKEIGYNSKYTFLDGIKETIAYYQNGKI